MTRRELLERCVVSGALVLTTSLSLPALAAAWDESEKKRKPTPYCELGPFYKREAPHTSVLRAPGDAGMPLALSGVVYDTRGEVVPDAKVEIWQTDIDGHYDIDGYRFRALLAPGPKGRLRHRLDRAWALSQPSLPTRPFPYHRTRTQSTDHADVLRD